MEDVVHHEDILAGQVRQLIETHVQAAGVRGRFAVTARPHHPEPDRPREPPDQIGDDHDAPVEHADDGQRPSGHIRTDSGGEPVDSGGYLRGCEQDVHLGEPVRLDEAAA